MLKIDILKDIDQYPICDTDIWVNINLANICSKAFEKYKKVIFADIVESEISGWERNDKYSFISANFIQSKHEESAFVIYHQKHIDLEDQDFMIRQLKDLNFHYGLDKMEKNKGEAVSAIYADHFGITVIKSNDSFFKISGLIDREFPDLNVKDWNIVSEELAGNHQELIQIRKSVEIRRPAMTKSFETHKIELKKEDLLQELQKKFNKRRN